MKWFAVLFIGAFAEGFVAPKCPMVNVTLLPSVTTAAALTFPTPTIANGDVSAGQFKEDYMKARQTYAQTLVLIHYAQASAIRDEFVDTIRKDYARLEESMKLISKDDKKSTLLNDLLKVLTNQLTLFLDLKPGNVKIKRMPLPDLPLQPTAVVSQTQNRTASDFFLNFPEVANNNYSSLYGYIAGIFLRGWAEARKYFDDILEAYRNDILNCDIMRAYRNVVENVFKNNDCIQRHVDNETWDAFKKAGVSIITISNDYNKSLKKKGVVNTVQ